MTATALLDSLPAAEIVLSWRPEILQRIEQLEATLNVLRGHRLPPEDNERALAILAKPIASVTQISAKPILSYPPPGNTRFSSQLCWMDTDLKLPTAAYFADDVSFWLLQSQGNQHPTSIHVSSDDAVRLVREVARRIEFLAGLPVEAVVP